MSHHHQQTRAHSSPSASRCVTLPHCNRINLHSVANRHQGSRYRHHKLYAVTSTANTMDEAASLPFLCGLTGSIGMGKSTVSAMFTQHGVPVLSADEIVHQLYAAGGAAVAPVGAAFPTAVIDKAIDRTALSKCVVGNEAAMKQLEGIVHPLVEAERAKFIQQHISQGSPLLVFDIPLLYETKADQSLDAVAVVSASQEQQYSRVMARPGMTAEKLQAILARQVPDAEKRQRADYIIDTGCSIEDTEQQVVQLIQQLNGRKGTAAAKLLAAAAAAAEGYGQQTDESS